MKEKWDTCAVRKEKLEGWKQREAGNKLAGGKKNRRPRVRNGGREGKKIDFERHHKMMWHHSVPMRQNHLHPSSHPQNNGRIYHAFHIHREDFADREEMT